MTKTRSRINECDMRHFFLVSALVMSGCSATGPTFNGLTKPGPDEAILYVYRPHNSRSRNSYPCVFINGEKRDAIKDGGYLVYRISPGWTQVKFAICYDLPMIWDHGPISLQPMDIKPSTRTYVRFYVDFSVWGSNNGPVISSVSEESALPELQNMALSN